MYLCFKLQELVFLSLILMMMGILSRLPIRNLVLRRVGHHEIPSWNYSTKRFRFSLIEEEKKRIEEKLEQHKKYSPIYREGSAVELMDDEELCARFSLVQQAFDLLPKFECPRTVRSFNALLDACIKFEKYDELKKLFRQLPSQLSITPNLQSYNIMIRGHCEMGTLESALEMFDEMEKKKGLKPDLDTFHALLTVFYSSGFSDGERIWSMMEQRNIKPDIESYNAKLWGMVMIGGKSCEAIKLVEELESIGEVEPDTDSYNTVLKGLCKDGNLEGAMRFYSDWCERQSEKNCDFVPRAYINDETYETLIHAAYDNGDLDVALEICLKYVDKVYWRSADRKVVQAVVDALAEKGREGEAKKLVELQRSHNWSRSRHKENLKMPTSKGISSKRQLVEKKVSSSSEIDE